MKPYTITGIDEHGKKVKHDVFAHTIADAVEIGKSIGVRSFNHVIQISKSMEADRCRQSKR
jgi:hypothetical protein